MIQSGSTAMKAIWIAVLMLSGSLAHAGAVTVDFDSTLPTVFGLETYQEDGFTLTSNVPDGTLIDDNNTVRANLGIFSGGTNSQSLFWGENGAQSTITMSNDGGQRFSVSSIDASSLYHLSGQLVVTGTRLFGGTVTQVLNLSDSISTYNLSGMVGLASLEFSFDGATYFAPFDLDNIQANVIPVPAAVWLFVSALGGLLGWSRHR
jgi:hypothetical protein